MKSKLLSLILALSFLTSFSNAQENKLTAAVPDWTGGEITCQLAVTILEEELGYKVKRVVFPSGTALWQAIADGEIDFACESWPSYAEADTKMLNENLIYEGKIVGSYSGNGSVDLLGTTGIIGLSDYYIPKYTADKLGIKSWRDLNKYKNKFATKNTGSKGRLIGCPVSGWNCHDQKRLDLLGIDFQAEALGTESAAISEAINAYNKKEPFLLYLWEPHWFLGEYEMVPIKLPDYKYCPTFTASNNWKVCGADSWPATGWAKDYTFNYGNPKTFAKPEYASAKKFFENMSLKNSDQNEMLVEVYLKNRDLKNVVKNWKDKNQNKWKTWLGDNSQIAIVKPDKKPEGSNNELAKLEEEKKKIEEEKRKIEEEKRKIEEAKKKQEEIEQKRKEADAKLFVIGSGTGFFVNGDGHIVSNDHVVGICKKVASKIEGEIKYFNVLKTDEVNDLGLIKGDYKSSKFLSIKSEGAEFGEDIVAFGYPLADALSTSVKLTRGIVSSLSGPGNNYSEIQIDAAIQPGNSGGPVLNMEGQVVGVASSGLNKLYMLEKSEYIPENVNFAVSASTLSNFLKANGIKIINQKIRINNTKELAKIGRPATIQLFCMNTKAVFEELKKTKKHTDVLFEKVIDIK